MEIFTENLRVVNGSMQNVNWIIVDAWEVESMQRATEQLSPSDVQDAVHILLHANHLNINTDLHIFYFYGSSTTFHYNPHKQNYHYSRYFTHV